MAEQIQIRRGSTTEHVTFTGANGEITVDTTKRTIVIHDGATAGGFPIPTKANGTFDKVVLTDNGGDSLVWVIEEDTGSATNAITFDYAGTERARLSSTGRITVNELEFVDTSSNSQTWKLKENASDQLSIIHGAGEVASISSAGDLTIGNILDSNGNEKLVLVENASAVNEIWISNAATSFAPHIFVDGNDPNIDLKLSTKGTGSIDVDSNKIINVNDPVSAQDAATKNYVDTTTFQNIVEDTTPQLGGQLDVNGFDIGDGTNVLLSFLENPLAANHIQIENATTGSNPIIRSDGSDLDIDLILSGKGAGAVEVQSPFQLATYTVATLPVTGVPGQMVFVEDGDLGSPTIAAWDGSNWRVLGFGAVAST